MSDLTQTEIKDDIDQESDEGNIQMSFEIHDSSRSTRCIN